MKVTKLKLNLCTTYIELCKNFEGEIERMTEMVAFIEHKYHHLKILIAGLNCVNWSQFANMLRHIWNPQISHWSQFSQWNYIRWCSQQTYSHHIGHRFMEFQKVAGMIFRISVRWGQNRLSSGLSSSPDLHKPPNLELILQNCLLVIYREIKYLESNLVCMNAVSMPVGRQHDTTSEISERID